MKVAVSAVQGAFIEHEQILSKLGVEVVELRQKEDVLKSFDRLILPGGESTVQGKLLRELDMYDTLKEYIDDGMPVLGTCAGQILLANKISNDSRNHFASMPITVKRNAYGRQLGSFNIEEKFYNIEKFPMRFIRAPYIEEVSPDVEILSVVKEKIVAVKYKKQIGVAFHPELTNDYRIHEMFLNM